ncbi:MAG: choice-of-anchor P family protein [Actinomycetota bacterium]|nr:choice-of-anchor P family protein [Actinomycetota bacterium]
MALDPGANSSAYGVSASLLSGAVNVPPTPVSTFPPGGTSHLVSVNLGAVGSVGVSDATTSGDSTAGTSSATAALTNVALLALPSVAAITADAVQATCSDTAPGAPTGSTTLTNAKLGGNTVLDVSPAANTKLINLPPLAVVTLNEQFTNAGMLTVNAIHIVLGPVVNGQGSLGDIIIGHVTCGPNAPSAVGDAFSFQNLPVILGGLAVIVLVGFGIRTGIRRLL